MFQAPKDKSKQHMVVVTITPQIADELLKNQHMNRRLKWGHVERFIEEMKAGRWRLSPNHPLIVDHKGRLVGGQHRLSALCAAKVSLQFWVCWLAETDSVLDVRMHDQAAALPSAADVLTFEKPDLPNKQIWAQTMKATYHLETGVVYSRAVSYAALRDLCSKFQPQMENAVKLCASAKLRQLVPSYFGGFIVWTTAPRPGGINLTKEMNTFAKRYLSGEDLRANDPEMVFRNYMLGNLSNGSRDRIGMLSRLASTFLSSVEGHKRVRVAKSRAAFEQLATILHKPCPSWIQGRAPNSTDK